MSQNKICSKCKVEKPIENFKKRNSKLGHRSECKECEKLYRATNKILISEKRKNHYNIKKKQKKTKEIKEILVKFMNGPLARYLLEDISYSKFKEEINEAFDIELKYSDIYPSPIFNAGLKLYHMDNE